MTGGKRTQTNKAGTGRRKKGEFAPVRNMEQIKITTSLTCRTNFDCCIKWWNLRLRVIIKISRSILELFSNLIGNKKPINIRFNKWYEKPLKHVIKIILWSWVVRQHVNMTNDKIPYALFSDSLFCNFEPHTNNTMLPETLSSSARQRREANTESYAKSSRSRFTRANFCLITDSLRHCFQLKASSLHLDGGAHEKVPERLRKNYKHINFFARSLIISFIANLFSAPNR